MNYSFVIPTHNNKVLLKNTLEALNHQDGFGENEYEVIVVDDGSTDNTFEHIKGINHNYQLKYLFLDRCEKSCRARTRNHGWKNTSGEIIIFIDSDIIVRKNFLHEISRCFSLNSDIVVIGNRLMLNKPVEFRAIQNGDVFEKFNFRNDCFDILEYRYFLYEITSYNANAILCPWTQIYSCNLSVPRKWLEKIGGFDENFLNWGMEDIELGYSLYQQNIQIIINHKLEVLHQYHGPRNDLIIKKEYIPGYKKNIDYFISKHPTALNMSPKNIHKFFSGEISGDKMFMARNIRYIGIDFTDIGQLDNIKRTITTNLLRPNRNTVLIVNDYLENTDFDIWIQLQKSDSNATCYYPASKRLNQHDIKKYLKEEKERQKLREQ